MNQPHKIYQHVYAVVRIDDFLNEDELRDDSVNITKVFWDQSQADKEAKRLNDLNGAKDAHYFVRMTRLDNKTKTDL
jgi:hypothetical protein